jgi:hypothetical protein
MSALIAILHSFPPTAPFKFRRPRGLGKQTKAVSHKVKRREVSAESGVPRRLNPSTVNPHDL